MIESGTLPTEPLSSLARARPADRGDALAHDRSRTLQAEQVRLLYASAPAALAATIVCVLMLAAVEWNASPRLPLLAWLISMAVLTSLRYLLVRRFRRVLPEQQEQPIWKTLFLAGAALAGLGWGSTMFFLLPESSIPHQVFLVFMLGGITAGAVSTLSARLDAFLWFSLPIMAPVALYFLRSGDSLAAAMAAMIIFFGLVMIVVAARVNSTLVHSLNLTLQNTDLLEHLRSHRMRLEQAEQARVSSDRRYQFFVDQATDIIYRTDQTGRFTFINAVAARVLRYSDTEIVGRHFLEFIRPDYRRTTERFYGRQFVRKTPTTYFECPVLTKDGRELWIGQNVQVLTELGQVAGFQAVARDITERKRAEAASRESEARYRTLYDNNPSMYFTVDATGTVRSVNQFGAEYLGYTPDELINGPVFTVIHAEDHAVVRRQLSMCFQRPNQLSHCEFRKVRKDGRMLWVKETMRVAHDVDGPPVVFIVCEDITKRKQAEQALAASEKRLKTILETEPECVKIVTEDSVLLDMNPAGLKMVEADKPEDVLGRSVLPIVAPAYRDAFAEYTRRVHAGQPDVMQFEIIGLKGSRRWVETHSVPLRNERNDTVGVLAVARDITERKRAEEALHAARQAREQLARNLHDNIIQAIYAIGLTVEESQSIARTSPIGATRKLDQVVASLNRVIREVRGYLAVPVEEQPETLSADELISSFKHLDSLMEHADGVRFDMAISPDAACALTGSQRAQFLSVAREAMSNSLRHSNASTARVSLACTPRGVRLEIRDNGVGFALSRMRNGNGGLKNIRLRARKIGANLDIASHPMGGTVVSLEIHAGL